MNIYVGNLSHGTSEQTLREAFEKYGQVGSVSIIMDRETGQSRGFAFVEMPDSAEAQQAITAIGGSNLDGRKLNVSEARPREPRSGAGDRGGRRGGGGGNRW
jgi:cold-inducible RNA-binding protein